MMVIVSGLDRLGREITVYRSVNGRNIKAVARSIVKEIPNGDSLSKLIGVIQNAYDKRWERLNLK